MVNITLLPLALVASLAAFGEARNCTPKLNYCGSVLLDIGKYFPQVADELIRSQKSQCLGKRHVTDSLFYCTGGPDGEIRYKGFCKNGCKNGGAGKNDHC
ncbi:hypothetical protein BGZ61DRAFT_592118 [Ilyonectria robusta]|uniref:uncharacterized protein n=1 Tax=Ilyonectria robusta TaxID=1079257 RepID=UPI001E8E521A|nr:uncharacterized protein BGZ61DRAFT_592118 [Ilyonectria robusta]KAH8670728.1 hypothetical protein BGZ61DRAFT_592118 [Ilyonectria robusta]